LFEELASRRALVEYAEIQAAYERGSTVGVIEAYWRALLREVSPRLRPVVEGAGERPRRCARFPLDSHQGFCVVPDLGQRCTTPYIRPQRLEGYELDA
jgi:hypothetical protein